MFKYIIFAVKHNDNSGMNLTHVWNLAVKFQAKVKILHVKPSLARQIEHNHGYFFYDFEQEALQEKLIQIKQQLSIGGVEVELEYVTGDIEDVLIQQANQPDCDLLILSQSRRSVWKRFFQANVLKNITPHIKRPIIILPNTIQDKKTS